MTVVLCRMFLLQKHKSWECPRIVKFADYTALSSAAVASQVVSKRLGTQLRAPQLESVGYSLVGGRLLPGENGPVAHMYQCIRGTRVTPASTLSGRAFLAIFHGL